ncbi:nucleoside diphosphate kinase 7-like [Hydractinia symbiolongicarpus]|uniref:nucleoside diphosphate kinase 7-like n=1 Tax=Hydractinia symbiolongicarpus TaxID=13093 RepID=UPI00254AD2E1|nr:nucleoside diphosphate kinase 7-like [Hydractinia symbiolongicarpus]
MASPDDRYAFIAEWYDAHAALVRRYQFLFYAKDATIEMFDIKNRRLFLKRSRFEELSMKDLYIGAIINIHARQLKITDYADQFTRNKLERTTSKTYAMIKPDAVGRAGEILNRIHEENFIVCQAKKMSLTRSEATKFYVEHDGKPFFEKLLDFMTSGPVIAIELMGVNCVKRWRDLLGPTNTAKAKEDAPYSIRAVYGTDATKNACHGSDSDESARREIEFFFGPASPRVSATFNNCTLCIIKPHAVAGGLAGNIITAIYKAGFQVSTLQMFRLEKANAEEFYEIYKGVVNEYMPMVDELCNGACIAMEITKDKNVATNFRELVGPSDPEIARHLRSQTLRARFGIDKIKNAVHCTDLPDDALLEVEYFFRILNS